MAQTVFTRKETKYILSREECSKLLALAAPKLVKDKHFKSTNCSVYFDTNDNYLAIHSLEKPLYKEKIRVRSYRVPKLADTVFVEIKKKFDGVGYKRRIPIKLADFYDYLDGGAEIKNSQIGAELDYCFRFHDLRPALFLAYDRTAFTSKDDADFRLTFDENIRHRSGDLRLENGDRGEKYFRNGEIVMEVKTPYAYPTWFIQTLSKLKIYPASFSKYGRVMQKL